MPPRDAPPPRFVIGGLVASVAVASLLNFWDLQGTPPAIGGDEAFFANHGLAIAQTGRDLNGRRLPLMLQVDPNIDPGLWYQVLLVYLEAATFAVLPFAEWSARLPVAMLAVVNTVLAWIVAVRYAGASWAGPVAATVVALSPIHFYLSRQAVDYIFPIAFVLLWLWWLSALLEKPATRTAFACGLVLGLGIFSYVASWLMMPLYLLVTIAVCLPLPGRLPLSAAAAAGFAIPAGALATWLLVHPDALASVMNRYAGGAAQLPGLNINTYYRFVDLVSAYWASWNPAQLFLIGSPNPIIGVRTAGVFVAPVAVLLIAGVFAMRPRHPLHVALIVGLVTAPIGPVLYGTPGAVQRQLVLIPFVAIVSALGAITLWNRSTTIARVTTMGTLALCPVLFAVAAVDVFANRDAYIVRFDPSNFRELTPALAALNREIDAPQVVIAIGPYDRRAYWHFHTSKLNELALRAKAMMVEAQSVRLDQIPANSLIVANAPSNLATELDRACTRVAAFRAEADVVVWRARGAGCGSVPP